ncbi:SDR family oxidoreductase [Williamsia sp. CHRR-6]|uniref:SDR family oxidoreductase n=1 Tax=Williamsia sp. CHRR-6 TaxID=2835871 RepID=UPI001BD9D396|nr:SDR family oxidoreductase [Williamsia sp. CHRR-6]MBT0566290.1 SDR family oxidoreductase [Williamsia sp. CHRR-6]
MNAAHPTALAWRERSVVRDGVRLAVFDIGDPTATTVVLVHGWPDTHHLWTQVAPILAESFHVVAYDTRGYGSSDAPDGDAAYTLPELALDLFAVARAVSERPVHVVAHDWGSVQTWEAVCTAGADDHIASFTSVSGPSLDQLGRWSRDRLTHPTPGSLRNALSQMASSAYTVLFQLPVVPKVFFAAVGHPAVWRRFLQAVEGTDPADIVVGPTLRRDFVSGLRYYRANIRPRLFHPNPRPTDIPVFEIVNHRDIALRAAIFDDTGRYAARLWRRDLPTGHWLPYARPQLLAQLARDFIESRVAEHDSPTIARARVTGRRGALVRTLTVITGGGSGIGRETALLFADQGSEVVVADIDLAAAEKTAAEVARRRGRAHAYALDVADTEALTAFAETVAARHGIADIVVNNAGIGLAGALLDATDTQLRRLVDINLMGVATGSRVFGRQMVARGAGGHIVNLASQAAYMPQRGLGAYAATKAAVLMLSESLGAELAEHRIGVSAICPGVVHTNITRTTEFAGRSAEEQERQRDRMDGLYRRRGFTPDRVATQILAAVTENRAVVPVTVESAVSYRLYRFFPGLTRRMARMKIL